MPLGSRSSVRMGSSRIKRYRITLGGKAPTLQIGGKPPKMLSDEKAPKMCLRGKAHKKPIERQEREQHASHCTNSSAAREFHPTASTRTRPNTGAISSGSRGAAAYDFGH